MHINSNIEKLQIIADALEEMCSEVVFIGGAVASLYINDPAAVYVRPTKDVDCIIQLNNRGEFSTFEKNLRKKSFQHDTSEDAPICRWIYRDIPVDIMPTESTIIGFSNRWYKEGISHPKLVTLPNGTDIALLSLPYFIATKIEAFHGRSETDFRVSHDIEDIIVVLDGVLSLDELLSAPPSLKKYLSTEFCQFLKESLFIEAVSAHIDQGHSPFRTKRIIDFLKVFCGT